MEIELRACHADLMFEAEIVYQAPLTFYYAAAISLTTRILFFSVCEGRLEIRLMGDGNMIDIEKKIWGIHYPCTGRRFIPEEQ